MNLNGLDLRILDKQLNYLRFLKGKFSIYHNIFVNQQKQQKLKNMCLTKIGFQLDYCLRLQSIIRKWHVSLSCELHIIRTHIIFLLWPNFILSSIPPLTNIFFFFKLINKYLLSKDSPKSFQCIQHPYWDLFDGMIQ